MNVLRRRAAFTLIELLVVASILAALFGLVITGTRRGDGSVRGAAQQFAALLRTAQSRALGNEVGAALILEADGDLNVVVSDSHVQPFIEGTVTDMPPPATEPSNLSTAEITVAPANAANEDMTAGYKIRFFHRPPGGTGRGQPVSEWFGFQSPAPPDAIASFQAVNGQTSRNTSWPSAPQDGTMTCCIARYPTKAGVAMTFPKVATVDLRYSGTGDAPGTTWGSLDGKGAIAVSFDMLGGIDALMQQVPLSAAGSSSVTPIDPFEPVYFLIVDRAERLSVDRQLASEKAFWVAVHPQTGQVTVASNVPQAGTDSAALIAARANARKAITIGK